MGKIPFARGFQRCLLIAGLNKLALGWRHECFSEHRLFHLFFIFLLLLLKSASKGVNEYLIQYGKSSNWALGVICELNLKDSLQASCEKTLGSGEGLSGSSDHKDMEDTAAWFVSLCDQCYKASLVSLYFLSSFWCFVQKDNKDLKLLSSEEFVQTVKRDACSQHHTLQVLLCFYTLS